MKKTAFYFIILIVSVCCINNSQKPTVNKIIQDELLSKKRNDTILLGFVFGMSAEEYNIKLSNLINENKVFIGGEENQLLFEMTVNERTVLVCNFQAEFYKEKLYKITSCARPKNYSNSKEIATIMATMVYIQKYGSPDVEEENTINKDCNTYIWIDGNRKIEISCGYDCSNIVYEDLIISEKLRVIDSLNKVTDFKNTQNSI